MKRYFYLVLTIALFASCQSSKPVAKSGQPVLKDFYDTASYAWGINIAEFLKTYYYSSLDADLMVQAFNKSLSGDSVLFSMEEVKEIVRVFGEAMIDSVYAKNEALGKAYREENASKPEVKVLESGLQFEVISSGWGEVYPVKGDRLIVHYDCYLIDGKKVDSSTDRMQPYEFVLGIGSVIAGWEEIAYKMREGDKFKVVIPATLAYEKSIATKGIPPGSTLVYEIKLLQLKAINPEN